MIHKIIDNFLPLPYLSRLQNLTYSKEMQYAFLADTVDHGHRPPIPFKRKEMVNHDFVCPDGCHQFNSPNQKDTPQFTSLIYSLYENGVEEKNSVYDDFSPILIIMEMYDMPVSRLIRMKMNCLSPHTDHDENSHHPAHPDWWKYKQEFPDSDGSNENWILIFFPFDTDGPFRIFENSLTNKNNLTELKVYAKVEPKANRAVVLRAEQFHAGSTPIEYNIRHSLNILFTSHANVL